MTDKTNICILLTLVEHAAGDAPLQVSLSIHSNSTPNTTLTLNLASTAIETHRQSFVEDTRRSSLQNHNLRSLAISEPTFHQSIHEVVIDGQPLSAHVQSRKRNQPSSYPKYRSANKLAPSGSCHAPDSVHVGHSDESSATPNSRKLQRMVDHVCDRRVARTESLMEVVFPVISAAAAVRQAAEVRAKLCQDLPGIHEIVFVPLLVWLVSVFDVVCLHTHYRA